MPKEMPSHWPNDFSAKNNEWLTVVVCKLKLPHGKLSVYTVLRRGSGSNWWRFFLLKLEE
jgi:hypothetical protein